MISNKEIHIYFYTKEKSSSTVLGITLDWALLEYLLEFKKIILYCIKPRYSL
jgi:hypothetical protein